MTINTKVHPFIYRTHLLVGHHPALVRDGASYELPSADAYARRIAEETEAWLDHARERSRMREATLVAKAIHSVAFTMRHRAHDFAVPSKLSGTSKHQKALWSMVKDHVALGARLDIEEVKDEKHSRLLVSYEGERLGEVQSKHVLWLRPLVPFSAGVFLVRVTGAERDYTLGCNVAFGRVGGAVAALNHALGSDVGTDVGGDEGASPAPTEAVLTRAQPVPNHSGDGAADGLQLVSSGLSVAKIRADINPEDVVLYRDIDGSANATVEHVRRHSQAVEWGYHGSGPADLARSILLQFADEATADRLYQAFKADVIAAVPQAGGVIRADEVRAWLAAYDG